VIAQVVVAHVGGVPVEEILLPLVSGVGAGLLLTHTWVLSRVRHRRSAQRDRPPLSREGSAGTIV
jgi:hypothetical protein